MPKESLFTYIADFRGGKYCSQVKSSNLEESLTAWISELRSTKSEIQYLSDKTIAELEIKIVEEEPVLLNGLENTWSLLVGTKMGLFWVTIVKTDSKIRNSLLHSTSQRVNGSTG